MLRLDVLDVRILGRLWVATSDDHCLFFSALFLTGSKFAQLVGSLPFVFLNLFVITLFAHSLRLRLCFFFFELRFLHEVTRECTAHSLLSSSFNLVIPLLRA